MTSFSAIISVKFSVFSLLGLRMQTLSQLKSGQLSGIKRLSLSENLSTFPEEILTLADSLEILDLSNNNLSALPDQLPQLSKLKIIFASNNNFTELPDILGKCKHLEMIGFKSNKITRVSEQSLPAQLRWLILTENKITKLPDSLGQRPRLQKLALAGNLLTHLPPTLAQSLNLELIRISANKMMHFPDQLLSLPKLAWIAFAGNPFSKNTLKINSVPSIARKEIVLHNVLGQGASGIISRANWTSKQRSFPENVAVKVFKGEVTSDGYPEDELQVCLKTGNHPNLVSSLAQVNEDGFLALIMNLIPEHYRNLGLPPNFETCSRDTFPIGFNLTIAQIQKIVEQMQTVFEHIHEQQVCHGDLYAHNTLFDNQANIIFGDFGAASMYHMLTKTQQTAIKAIERRALFHFIDDLLNICVEEDKRTTHYKTLKEMIT